MNKSCEVVTAVVESVDEYGNVKLNGLWHKVSKFSAFKDFKGGETYTVEVEPYEYQGFLKRRIMRVVPK